MTVWLSPLCRSARFDSTTRLKNLTDSQLACFFNMLGSRHYTISTWNYLQLKLLKSPTVALSGTFTEIPIARTAFRFCRSRPKESLSSLHPRNLLMRKSRSYLLLLLLIGHWIMYGSHIQIHLPNISLIRPGDSFVSKHLAVKGVLNLNPQ